MSVLDQLKDQKQAKKNKIISFSADPQYSANQDPQADTP